MSRFHVGFWLAVLTLKILEGAASAADEKTTLVKLPVSDHAEIQLNAPANWKYEIRDPKLGLEATLEFNPKSGMPFHVLLTPIPQAAGKSKEELRKFAELMAESAKQMSVEKTLELTELKGASVLGFSFSATDRAPKAGEFKYITSGVIKVSSNVTSFTILTNDGQQDVVKQALAMLQSAKSAAVEIRFVKSTIAIPDANWAIEFESPKLGKPQERREGNRYAMRGNAGRFNISIFVEEPHGEGKTHEDCFKFYAPKLSQNPKVEKESIKSSAHENYHRMQYDVVLPIGESKFTLRNVHFFFIHENRWVDVHISIAEPTADDVKIITTFEKSLQYKQKA